MAAVSDASYIGRVVWSPLSDEERTAFLDGVPLLENMADQRFIESLADELHRSSPLTLSLGVEQGKVDAYLSTCESAALHLKSPVIPLQVRRMRGPNMFGQSRKSASPVAMQLDEWSMAAFLFYLPSSSELDPLVRFQYWLLSPDFVQRHEGHTVTYGGGQLRVHRTSEPPRFQGTVGPGRPRSWGDLPVAEAIAFSTTPVTFAELADSIKRVARDTSKFVLLEKVVDFELEAMSPTCVKGRASEALAARFLELNQIERPAHGHLTTDLTGRRPAAGGEYQAVQVQSKWRSSRIEHWEHCAGESLPFDKFGPFIRPLHSYLGKSKLNGQPAWYRKIGERNRT